MCFFSGGGNSYPCILWGVIKMNLAMTTSVYQINRGINKPVEFKGLKAQYIWYLGGGLLVLLVAFAILYICGVNTLVCLGVIIISGTMLFMHTYKLSNKYGQYGLMKSLAKRSIPTTVKNNSRKTFVNLSGIDKNKGN